MTNEEILVVFLKSRRKYKSFKSQANTYKRTVIVKNVITSNLRWSTTKEGMDYWFLQDSIWTKLCRDMGLTGTIQLPLK